jgi:protocatechuate 3,4-dioxygenase beta subunit
MPAFITLCSAAVYFLLLNQSLLAQDPEPRSAAAQTADGEAARTSGDSMEEDLARVKALLASGKATVEEVMASTEWSHLREKPRFRRAIREAATSPNTVIVPSDEPGTPLVVSGVVRDESGAPLAGAQVYVFQTSESGSYSSRGGNARDMGDSLNPRLFGYMKTGADGRYEFRTIRPGQYPTNGPPAHIHYEVNAPGFDKMVSEFMLEDDSRMTPETKKWAVEAGFVVATPKKRKDGSLDVTVNWTLQK